MRSARWVVELGEVPGRAPSDERAGAIVDHLARKLASPQSAGTVIEVRSLVCPDTVGELDDLRARAAAIAASRREEFSHEDWQFGGYVAIETVVEEGGSPEAVAFAKTGLAEAIRSTELDLRQGPWLESVRPAGEVRDDLESFVARVEGTKRLPRDLLFSNGHKLPTPGQDLSESAVGLTVIDRDWWLEHEEIDSDRVSAITPSGAGTGAHGLATLGVLIGRNGGIIPWLPSVGLLSPFDRCGGTEVNWTDAVLHAAVDLPAGGVVLVEQQDELYISGFGWRNLPPEVYPGVAKAIGLASAAGITVVEAAGNAGKSEGVNFDSSEVRAAFLTGEFVWPGDRDSGAVLVGAVSPLERECLLKVSVNTGSRLDIRAPGSCYRAAGWYPRTRPDDFMTVWSDGYGQTSGASAIVAGVLVLIQTLRCARGRGPLMPTDLREVVRDVAASARAKPGCGMGVHGAPNVDDFVAAALAIK